MVSAVHASARVFRVRTEFVGLTREMRVHVLCECGSGAWIAAIAPFPDLFFDERPLLGRSVGEALAWLGDHYTGVRVLADILGSPASHGDGSLAPVERTHPSPRTSNRKTADKARPRPEGRRRQKNGDDEHLLALPLVAKMGAGGPRRRT
jgi:hypothetical protein